MKLKQKNAVLKSLVILTSLLFVLSSCNQNQSARVTKKHLSEIEKKISIDKSGKEDFISFFEFFKKDTIFELERTSPPYVIRIVSVQFNAAGDLKHFIDSSFNKKEWRPGSWVSRKPPIKEIKNDSAFVIFNDSISVRNVTWKHIFIRSKGKWFLKSLKID